MQKMNIDTADVQAVQKTLNRRRRWRRFWHRLKRIFWRMDSRKRWRKWISEAEMLQRERIQKQIQHSRLWRENFSLAQFEKEYSPRYRATGELKASSISNPGFSFDIAEMPTLQETDALKIEELQF